MAAAAAKAQKVTAHELCGEQILKIVKELRLACCAAAGRSCSFMDVFSADQLPKVDKLCSFAGAGVKRKKRGLCCFRARSFVANTDPSDQPGCHWVAFVVFADRPSVIYFFDSFGFPLTSYDDLYRTCMNNAYFSDTHIVTSINSRSLQGPASAVCGHYCVLFLYVCARVSLDVSRSRISALYGFALRALRALVQVTGGDSTTAPKRDAAIVRVLNELLARKKQLAPALCCSGRRTTSAAHHQCCRAQVA